MFNRQSVQDGATGAIVVTYDYHESNEIMHNMVDVSIYEDSDIASYAMTKEEVEKLIKILEESVK